MPLDNEDQRTANRTKRELDWIVSGEFLFTDGDPADKNLRGEDLTDRDLESEDQEKDETKGKYWSLVQKN